MPISPLFAGTRYIKSEGLVQRLASLVHTDVQIALRRSEIRVTQHLFDQVNILTSSIHPGAEGVPQIMKAKLGPTDLFARRIERAFD